MNFIDIIILLCCIPAFIQGLFKGFVNQAFSLISIVLGAWASFKLSNPLATWLHGYMDISGTILQVIAFAIILSLVIVGLHLLSNMIEKMLKFVMLGWVNKMLGASFAVLKVVLVIGLVIVLVDALNTVIPVISQEKIDNSLFYTPVKELAQAVFPYLKELIFNK